MERASNFFFLYGISDNVKCDFSRSGTNTLLTFCNILDVDCVDKLDIVIRTDSAILSDQVLKEYFISYTLSGCQGTMKQVESLPIHDSEKVWGIVRALVNDVFK